jgi:hypothetical protein
MLMYYLIDCNNVRLIKEFVFYNLCLIVQVVQAAAEAHGREAETDIEKLVKIACINKPTA